MARYRIRRRFKRRRVGRRPFRRYRKTFRKKVRRVILQSAELKQGSLNIDEDLPSGYLRLEFMPPVGQGAGDNQRIGNKIMSRNFQLKTWLQVSTQEVTPVPGAIVGLIRLYIVWPRQFSRSNAIPFLNSDNFPLYGMMDQDNWIVWQDHSIAMSNIPQATNKPSAYRWEFNKRFYTSLEYAGGLDTLAVKTPWIIITHNFDPTRYRVRWRGYIKCSYKDI